MSDTEESDIEDEVEEEEEDESESEKSEKSEAEDEDEAFQDVDREPEVEKPEQSRVQLHKNVIRVSTPHTREFLTKTELVELIGIRAGQIANRSQIFVDITRKDGSVVDNPAEIAKMEILQRRCPLTWRRIIKTTTDKTGQVTEYVQYFDVNKMELAPL